MSTILSKQVIFLLSITAFTLVASELSAQADTTSAQQSQQNTLIEVVSTSAPAPGTITTDATALLQSPRMQQTPAKAAAPKVAQIDIAPGRDTRSGASYVGIAGNIGITGGSTALGDGNFAVITKIGLTDTISIRPGAVISGDSTILLPVTYDFSFNPADAFTAPLPIAPYVGAGVVIATGDDTDVGPMLTAGVDYPITSQFTATAALNVGFVKDTSLGLLIGVGYNFGRLF